MCRSLSFKDAEFRTLSVVLSRPQRRVYDDAVGAWLRLRADLATALTATRAPSADGASHPSHSLVLSLAHIYIARMSCSSIILSSFFIQFGRCTMAPASASSSCSASPSSCPPSSRPVRDAPRHTRSTSLSLLSFSFFALRTSRLTHSLPLSLSFSVKAALAAGEAAVVGLQSTGEAALDSLGLAPNGDTPFVSVCRETLLGFVKAHFPTRVYPVGANGGSTGGGAGDGDAEAAGAPGGGGDDGGDDAGAGAGAAAVASPDGGGGGGSKKPTKLDAAALARLPLCAASDAARSRLIELVEDLDLPTNPLDELIDALGGTSAVAELTGRKGRIVRDSRGRTVYKLRTLQVREGRGEESERSFPFFSIFVSFFF